MKINSMDVIELRNARSWSQEELAIASGLNLRTVQRIEREGSISLQSKKALAGAFGIDASELDYVEPILSTRFEYQTVVLKNDVSWLSGWGKKTSASGPYQLDNAINEYGKDGWKVHTISYGSSVHGGAGQVMVLFERQVTETSTDTNR